MHAHDCDQTFAPQVYDSEFHPQKKIPITSVLLLFSHPPCETSKTMDKIDTIKYC
jgi:hypothetical protein